MNEYSLGTLTTMARLSGNLRLNATARAARVREDFRAQRDRQSTRSSIPNSVCAAKIADLNRRASL
jgi:hypothetical protein